jgi:Kef-type K+ transport system membrane component KefB
LLFEAGLESDISKLALAGKKSLTVAIAGVVLPFVFGYLLARHILELNLLTSLFIGSTLTATSIGITLRVLKDINKHDSKEGHIVIGAAVIDDILGIIILSILYEFATNNAVEIASVGKVFLLICLFFFLAPFAAKVMSHTIMKWEQNDSKRRADSHNNCCCDPIFCMACPHQHGEPPAYWEDLRAGLALSRQFFSPFASFLKNYSGFP